MSYIFVGVIKIYQYSISPLLAPARRFEPTCSAHGIEAFKKHGVLKGFFLTVKRILKCHPWGGSGHDPVP